MSFSRDTCCREAEIFSGSVERNNRRSVGVVNNKRWSKIRFSVNFSFCRDKRNTCKCKKFTHYTAGGRKIIKKGAIEIVPWQDTHKGFYSTFFLVPKKSGGLRPVINLRPLNRYLKKQHFKMDSLSTVLNLVQQGDWAISLDLTDAYMHIPIHKAHKKFLRFCIQGKVYQFTCLCFGPAVAPRVFTKVVSVAAAHLRTLNLRLNV